MDGTANSNNPSTTQTTVETPEISLDILIDQKLGAPEFASPEAHKGINFAEVLDQLPPDARKLVHNLREDYRKKTTAISQRAKELEMKEAALLSPETQAHLAALSNVPEGLDLYSPDGLEKYIAAKTAEQLQKAIEPARQAQAVANRKAELANFAAQHPDFDSHKPEIIKLIESNVVSSAEDGYWLIRGKAATSEQARLQAELEAYKAAARQAGMKVTTGTPSQNTKPAFKTALEAYEWRKLNPGR